MNLRTSAHRVQQVVSHVHAVTQQWLSSLGLAEPVGAAGDEHLRALKANQRVRQAFAAAHPADQLSATRIAASLLQSASGRDDQLAAFLHDLPKGHVGLVPRVIHVLEGSPVSGRARGPWATSRQRLRRHAADAPAHAARLGAPRGAVALLRELARHESRHASGLAAGRLTPRAQRILELDSGWSR